VVTHELRWFTARAISDAELLAFGASALERRSDDYLRGTDELRGIKQRNGKQLEDKRRTAIFALSLEIDAQLVHGSVERWHKRWPRQLEPELDGGEWLSVHKRRAVLVRDACRVELTGLLVGDLEFQTLAFETLEIEDPVSTIARCARIVLHEHPELLVRIVDQPSLGYPAWLGSLGSLVT
jgi:CRP-like cAMP-binding protein